LSESGAMLAPDVQRQSTHVLMGCGLKGCNQCMSVLGFWK
jgi:hypothetical protein